MDIKLAIFDLAGTTIHDEDYVAKALQQALSNQKVEISIADANRVMGMPKPVAIELLLNEKLQDKSLINYQFIDSIYQDFLKQMLHFYSTSEIKEIPGTSETFRKLKKAGIKIGIDTGFSREITDAILKRMEWDSKGLLDVSVASDEVENGRPFPDMVFKSMLLSGVKEASQVAKVGDTPADLNEGHSAGCGLVIGVLSGATSKEELERHPHTHIVKNIKHITDIINV